MSLIEQIQNINIKDYSYVLPDSSIAKYPLAERDASRLLIYENSQIKESTFKHLASHIPDGSLLVFNNTKVIHARILFEKHTGAQIEIFCLEPTQPHDYSSAFTANNYCLWECMVGNAKRWKGETLQKTIEIPGGFCELFATLEQRNSDSFTVKFFWNNANITFGELLHMAGMLPIPPYLNRDTEKEDETRYQTLYAKKEGSVAAPTAGLHFTEYVFNTLQAKQIDVTELTLHVGAGTFKPVKSERIADHHMHEESIYVSVDTITKLVNQLQSGKPILAVGTTSMRTLESLYWYGVQLMHQETQSTVSISQWYAYECTHTLPSPHEALSCILKYAQTNGIDQITGTTQLIIAPGYTFRVVDAIITNFHQPENTLILLIAAFVGGDWEKIYAYALANSFRFLSYGDSSLLFKHPQPLVTNRE